MRSIVASPIVIALPRTVLPLAAPPSWAAPTALPPSAATPISPKDEKVYAQIASKLRQSRAHVAARAATSSSAATGADAGPPAAALAASS